jgi:ABC-type amino acid transport substrate-binding protein
MKDGHPAGVIVDLARALAQRTHRRVEIRPMTWTRAQELVQEGRADALLQINPSPERREVFDFSAPLLTSEFTVFTASRHMGVTSVQGLEGLKVGVEEKGLPGHQHQPIGDRREERRPDEAQSAGRQDLPGHLL